MYIELNDKHVSYTTKLTAVLLSKEKRDGIYYIVCTANCMRNMRKFTYKECQRQEKDVIHGVRGTIWSTSCEIAVSGFIKAAARRFARCIQTCTSRVKKQDVSCGTDVGGMHELEGDPK